MLLWRYDPLALQGHLTNRQVDAFLTKVLSGFPEDAQQCLVVGVLILEGAQRTADSPRYYLVYHPPVYRRICWQRSWRHPCST